VLLLGAVGFGTLALTAGWVPPGLLSRFCAVEIALDGPGTLTASEVRAILGAPSGGPLQGLDWQAAYARLAHLPRIKRAELCLGGWRRVRLEIAERRAVGLLLGPDGQALEVAADGMLMNTRGRCLADLPLISWDAAALGREPAAGEQLAAWGAPDLLAVLSRLQSEFPALWDGVSEAHLVGDGTYELYWNDLPTVVWGRGVLSTLRLQAWAGVMEDLRRRGETDAVVDLRFHEQILVRLPVGPKAEPSDLG
jgi:cell division septal protein FtsQ